jgi:tetratricopeptide (TPR) repeat protein
MLLASIACVWLVAAVTGLQRSPDPTRPTRENYRALVVRYAEGDFDGATAVLARWAFTDTAFRGTRQYWRDRPDPTSRKAAALLHFETAIKLGDKSELRAVADRHLAIAEGIARIMGEPDFERLWRLTYIAYRHSQLRLPDAHRAIHGLLERFVHDPELLLAHASLLETCLTPLARGVPRLAELEHVTPLLLVAAAFRDALKADPNLAEARVRLGAVLLRLDEPKDAIRELNALDPPGLPAFLAYLRALVLGAAHERLDAAHAAAGHSRDAIAAYPEAQTGYIALMHLLQKRGDRVEARVVLERWHAIGQTTERRDPWWVYWFGQYWMQEHRLKILRAALAVRQK